MTTVETFTKNKNQILTFVMTCMAVEIRHTDMDSCVRMRALLVEALLQSFQFVEDFEENITIITEKKCEKIEH